MLKGKVLLTGGSGTLGKAIIKRATEENWDCQITVFSTDAMKHAALRVKYPHVQCIVGDIRDFNILLAAMSGKDYVLHLAAVKHIPISEINSIDTFDVNVQGSLNVCMAAFYLGTPHVLGISTDKVCHAANAYGATKYLMEKIFQEYARMNFPTQFHLVRYGNVLESTGSVVEAWKKSVERGEAIKITDPEMTRFWLSPSQAVDMVLDALTFRSGLVYIPKMPALSIGKLAEYTLGEGSDSLRYERIPLRPGEKIHETLLTLEELKYAHCFDSDYFTLRPTTEPQVEEKHRPESVYSSDVARELTKVELEELLHD